MSVAVRVRRRNMAAVAGPRRPARERVRGRVGRDLGCPHLQRLRGPLLASPGRCVLRGHPQLVRRLGRARLVLRQPDLPDPAPAAGRDPGVPDRRPLWRPRPRQRPREDRPRGRGIGPQQGRRTASGERPEGGRQGGRGDRPGALDGNLRAVPVSHPLRAGGRAPGAGTGGDRELPEERPAAGGGPDRRGLRPPGDGRKGLRGRRAHTICRHAAHPREAPDAAGS